MKVVQLPTVKNINYQQNKPFMQIKGLFEVHRKAINFSKCLIYFLLISNLLSWIMIIGLSKAFIEHDHNVGIKQETDYSVPDLPLIDEVITVK